MFSRPLSLLAMFFILLISCNTDDNGQNCDTDNPLEEISWLKEIKFVMEANMKMTGSQIIRYKYKGEYVFLVNTCYNCMDGLISVYDCDGEVICEFGGFAGLNTCPDFESEATDSTMLFDFVQH